MKTNQTLLAAHMGVIGYFDYSDVYTLPMEMSTLTFFTTVDVVGTVNSPARLSGSLNFVSNLPVALMACCLSFRAFTPLHCAVLGEMQCKMLVIGDACIHTGLHCFPLRQYD